MKLVCKLYFGKEIFITEVKENDFFLGSSKNKTEVLHYYDLNS